MGVKIIHIHPVIVWAIVCLCSLSAISLAQEPTLDMPHRGGDPNSALIEGRVLLPSGQSANFNAKIILSDLNRPLNTLYTNKHAEFRFPNLSEGEYYVQAMGDEKIYEPVSQKVRLARGQTVQLTLTLRKKEEVVGRKTGAKVVSASEFDQPAPAAARKEYDQSMRLISKGNVEQAIERLQRAIAIYPDYLDARNDLGAQYLKLKRFDEAAEQFRVVLEKNPKYFNSRFNLGLVLIERKIYAAAIEQFNQAIAIDSARPEARLWLGVALLQTNDLQSAERELSKAVIMGGTELAESHYYLAQIFLRRGDTAEASRALKAYLGGSPKGEFAAEARSLLKKLAVGSSPAKPH
jgi:tetratricopeptide (TPR) repeat protein